MALPSRLHRAVTKWRAATAAAARREGRGREDRALIIQSAGLLQGPWPSELFSCFVGLVSGAI